MQSFMMKSGVLFHRGPPFHNRLIQPDVTPFKGEQVENKIVCFYGTRRG